MSLSIDNLTIEDRYLEWAVTGLAEGLTYIADDEDDARLTQLFYGGTVVTRTVFETAWAEAA